jgi:gamma-glutamylcyclotransferase (GGCT)/AIG2-like uncharacterized protein YtfP
MNVFTYGTLMFPEIWQRVAGRAALAVRGHLAHFSIYRVDGAEYPGVIASNDGDYVKGVLYLDVDAASLASLDAFEGDLYRRAVVSVDCDDGVTRQAETYVIPPERRDVLTSEPWRADQFVAGGGLDRFARCFEGFDRLTRG